MSFPSLQKALTHSRSTRAKRAGKAPRHTLRTRRLRCEPLEDRRMLAGISFQPDAIATSDDGETDTISVRLTEQPESNVFINATSSDESEGDALPASLLFTPANWNQVQNITVTGVGDDGVVDGDALYEIELAVDTNLTQASEYLTVDPVYVPAINRDSDGIIIINSEDTPKAIADTSDNDIPN